MFKYYEFLIESSSFAETTQRFYLIFRGLDYLVTSLHYCYLAIKSGP